ncbi:MAG: NAD-dependent epimerase/dehydratase family protein [Acidobacteria bacterium]|nr:NAD-dependent epimerase/dehydratase family protein [Acidobacteriota bacterium]
MSEDARTVIVTGAAGNLGTRLLPMLDGFRIVAVDRVPPVLDLPFRFEQIDFGREQSCRQLLDLLRETGASAVVHLAFVIDPQRTGVTQEQRMWQINVAGTARVMEAISVVNRSGGQVKKLVYPSSVSVYGPDLPKPVTEEQPLAAHTLPYAVHKREADQVVQARASTLGDCSVYLLRPNIFAGASMENYLIDILRNRPYGRGWLGRRLREKGKRLPAILPFGEKYMATKFQYIHVDDVARLMAYLLRREPSPAGLKILNVAGRGESLSFRRCAQIAGAKVVRVPGKFLCRLLLEIGWKIGAACVPPQAVPYFTGTYTMDTTRLQKFLGKDYEDVIRYTVEDALADSFVKERGTNASAHAEQAVSAAG